jgi:putative transposase
VRWVYNAALNQRTWYGRAVGTDCFYNPETGDRSSRFSAIGQAYQARTRDFKEDPELEWLSNAPGKAIQIALLDLDQAFKNFFERRARYPSYRRYGENESVILPKTPGLRLGKDCVRLPKLGWVRYVKHKKYRGIPKRITVIYDAGKWYLSVTCVIEIKKPDLPLKPAIGIDLGITQPMALSDGTLIDPDIGLRSLDSRKRRLQRELSRCKRGSRRRQLRKAKVSAISRHIADRRKARCHSLTTEIARNFSKVILEDLKVKNMTKSAKGTAEAPGRNVKAKSGLNREMLNVSPYQIRQQLTYKLEATGGEVIAVNPAYSSQTCSQCGAVDRESRRSQSKFECTSCEHSENADINAAKILLQRGLGTVVGPRKTPSESHRRKGGSSALSRRSATSNPVVHPSRVGDISQNQGTENANSDSTPDG